MSQNLTPQKALIFRILHRDNVPWLLDHGLHCPSSGTRDPNYVNIGNAELIEKRKDRIVECPPGGHLSDYVPFYFTPFSPMLFNIQTGRGVRQRSNDEIVIAVSSLHHLREQGVPFVFTDRHAYLQAAQFSSDLARLDWIEWPVLRRRDFKKDEADKFERYQAEALVYRHVPIAALLGIACYNDLVAGGMKADLAKRGRELTIVTKPGWYF